MGGEVFKRLLGSLVKNGEELPDNRKGPNLRYTLNDAIKSAFGVFFFQFPSLLRYMTEMENKRKRNNARSLLVSCGRSRWKIENEHNNVLKNRGYNLEHNFGHGKEHASQIFFLLNLLAFQFHTILEYCDEEYRKVRSTCSTRVGFFEAIWNC